MLNELGVAVDVTTAEKKVETTVPEYTTEETVYDMGQKDPDDPTSHAWKKVSHTYQSGTVPVTETIQVA